MSNLIFVLYVEQNKQDRVGRLSNELSGNEITEITHPEDKERVFVLECGVTVSKLLDLYYKNLILRIIRIIFNIFTYITCCPRIVEGLRIIRICYISYIRY